MHVCVIFLYVLIVRKSISSYIHLYVYAGPMRGGQGVRCPGARIGGRGPGGALNCVRNEKRVKRHKKLIKEPRKVTFWG